jgi:hypothetical protein
MALEAAHPRCPINLRFLDMGCWLTVALNIVMMDVFISCPNAKLNTNFY